MTLSFWHRTLVASVVTTLLVGLFSAGYYDVLWGVRYTLVSLWTVGNFWLLGRVLRLVCTRSAAWRIALWTFVKIAVWYTLGYVMLVSVGPERTSLLVGFHTLFLVLLLRVLGKYLSETDSDSKELPVGNGR